MASIKFYSEKGGTDVELYGGSGLGFYGSGGFGHSVPVSYYQENTYITDADGVDEGPQCNNVKWIHANSGELSGAVQKNLLDISNAHASLNIRFSHTSVVQVQNVELRIYDRNDIDYGASGVTSKVAEIIHPSATETGQLGSGDAAWITPAGSSVVVPLSDCPGESGLYAGSGAGSTQTDDRHDWYVAISARPDSIGSKTQYGLYVSLEYL